MWIWVNEEWINLSHARSVNIIEDRWLRIVWVTGEIREISGLTKSEIDLVKSKLVKAVING